MMMTFLHSGGPEGYTRIPRRTERTWRRGEILFTASFRRFGRDRTANSNGRTTTLDHLGLAEAVGVESCGLLGRARVGLDRALGAWAMSLPRWFSRGGARASSSGTPRPSRAECLAVQSPSAAWPVCDGRPRRPPPRRVAWPRARWTSPRRRWRSSSTRPRASDRRRGGSTTPPSTSRAARRRSRSSTPAAPSSPTPRAHLTARVRATRPRVSRSTASIVPGRHGPAFAATTPRDPSPPTSRVGSDDVAHVSRALDALGDAGERMGEELDRQAAHVDDIARRAAHLRDRVDRANRRE